MVQQMEWNMRRVLANDTSAISTLRCLKLYLERLGCNFLDQESVQMLAGGLCKPLWHPMSCCEEHSVSLCIVTVTTLWSLEHESADSSFAASQACYQHHAHS